MCNINYNMYIILNLFHFYLALCFVPRKFIDRVHRKCTIYFVSPYWRHPAELQYTPPKAPLCFIALALRTIELHTPPEAPLCFSTLATIYRPSCSTSCPAGSALVFQLYFLEKDKAGKKMSPDGGQATGLSFQTGTFCTICRFREEQETQGRFGGA